MKKNNEQIKGTACCGTWKGERSRTGRKRLGGGGGGVWRGGGHGGAEGQFGQGGKGGDGGMWEMGGCCWLRGLWLTVVAVYGGAEGAVAEEEGEEERGRKKGRGEREGRWRRRLGGWRRPGGVGGGWVVAAADRGRREGEGVEFVVDGNGLGMGVSSGFVSSIPL
ncbi:glycine-rich cell wall structural protein 1.8-like [Arachis stenosperma]|uniref:glycine-rich cell wall structural protein 1.8-like n=1 Tax=Arachis stenosperma TaxID=217475 RepID=UPI0025AC5315|nr:glycine-rich cell wall structural protein 1.8-like [Arachis stenosperma]